jgi:hypothetical protein
MYNANSVCRGLNNYRFGFYNKKYHEQLGRIRQGIVIIRLKPRQTYYLD